MISFFSNLQQLERAITLSAFVLSCLSILSCTTVRQGTAKSQQPTQLRYKAAFIPLQNATDDPHAATALTEIVGTALLQQGVVYQLSKPDPKTDSTGLSLEPSESDYLTAASKTGSAFAISGSVHEFRYKTDLDGDPAVGLTLRIIRINDRSVIWQGSASRVGVAYSSLTSASQHAAEDLVSKLPVTMLERIQ